MVALGAYIFQVSTGNGALELTITPAELSTGNKSAFLLGLVFENPGWVDWMCSLSSPAIKFGSRITDDILEIK